MYLDFAESFDPNWVVRVGNFNWFSVLTSKNYFVANSNHFKDDAGLNSFLISPEEVCKEFACTRNASGTYDMSVTLYFRPQSYFYLGLIISGATLLSCLGYLAFAFFRRKKEPA